MAWYDEAVFYHIYPLGLTGAPKQNSYGEPEHRLNTLIPWIAHIKNIGCNALYIGPLFESVGHGYETTDYKKLDSRLGDNKDLTDFVKECHNQGVKVIFDGVFNHTGRDFFAFKDLKEKREGSQYRDWYCNVNFWGNNEYNDGFSYANWSGYNLLVKLNQRNPAVRDYICDVIRFWVSEFDVDGIRLDAADVLDFEFMKALRSTANDVKADFWLMGEVIHGDYIRWVNENTLHSVTNYHLHKALYSGHNDHNYFEIAHTVKRLYDMGGNRPNGLKLYNFVDNHDVERIYTKLNNKAHFKPVHILMYTLPGIPSIYYGSEFAIEGKKERFSDDSLRPALNLEEYGNAVNTNPGTALLSSLGKIRQQTKALSYGDYKELFLTNRQYAFSRNYNGESVVVTVNNDDSDYVMTLPAGSCPEYIGALSGQRVSVSNGSLCVNVKANSGDIWVPYSEYVSENIVLTPTVSEEVSKSAVSAPTVVEQVTACETYGENCTQAASGVDVTETVTAAEAANVTETVTETENVTETVTVAETVKASISEVAPEKITETHTEQATANTPNNEDFERGKIAGLQEAIIAIMEKKGPVTEQMKRDVYNNTHHGSLITWVKSFN